MRQRGGFASELRDVGEAGDLRRPRPAGLQTSLFDVLHREAIPFDARLEARRAG
jgi:hypothetical protein